MKAKWQDHASESQDWRLLSKQLRSFASKVRVSDGCWEWIGRVTSEGYGHYDRGYHDGISVLAHRWGYTVMSGLPVPEGYEIDHLCRNRKCVRPDHLECVTAEENKRRSMSIQAVNARKTQCPRGHAYTRVIPSKKTRGIERYCVACQLRSTKHERRNEFAFRTSFGRPRLRNRPAIIRCYE